MKDLRSHVERAVRPVQATRRRKLEMREELLAHLQDIYDEELARSNGDSVAQQAAIERFGPAAALSQQLAASVPWYDPVLPWLNPTRHLQPMSFWKVALGISVIYLTLISLSLGLMSGIFSGISALECAAVVVVSLAIISPVFLTLCAMAGAIHGVLRHRKAPRRAILYGAGLAGYLLASGLGLMTLVHRLDAATITWAIAMSLAGPLIIAISATYMGNEIRKDEETLARLGPWEAIELPAGSRA